MVWEDSGTGGRPGSMWMVNSLRTMWVTKGHEPPTDLFYDFKVGNRMPAQPQGPHRTPQHSRSAPCRVSPAAAAPLAREDDARA